ncbi:MAG TPA: monovalent cation/H+ antiporter complex subunit F [Caldilineaceae bacterium]|nr:monovalent cation/H+ antiporter complex subunit F [Caldilineaceae bacterium]
MDTFDLIIDGLMTILVFSFLICFIRLYRGPDVPNRTVAFDTIAVHAVALTALFSIRNDAAALLDVAIVTAVLGFLGTTMLARYLERSQARRGTESKSAPAAAPRTDQDLPTR